jgi:hypothetical protein
MHKMLKLFKLALLIVSTPLFFTINSTNNSKKINSNNIDKKNVQQLKPFGPPYTFDDYGDSK